MNLRSSRSAEGDYFQSEEFRLDLDDAMKTIRLERNLVRYGPGDDFSALTDEVVSFDDVLSTPEIQARIAKWFGEKALSDILERIG